jgi:hypothetical protein
LILAREHFETPWRNRYWGLHQPILQETFPYNISIVTSADFMQKVLMVWLTWNNTLNCVKWAELLYFLGDFVGLWERHHDGEYSMRQLLRRFGLIYQLLMRPVNMNGRNPVRDCTLAIWYSSKQNNSKSMHGRATSFYLRCARCQVQ